MLKKSIKISLFLLVTAAVLSWIVIDRVLPYTGIRPYRMQAEEHAWRFMRGIKPENFGLNGQKFSVVTADTVRLEGWYIEPREATPKGIVLLLHGIGSCKETQLERAERLAKAGFASVIYDLRAHGKSSGPFCTFGYYEKHDTRAIMDYILETHPGLPIGIWGVSLGGAVALQTLGLDDRLEFGIIESTFDEFEKVAVEYGADYMFGIRNEALTNYVLSKSGAIAQFDPDSVKPVESCTRIQCPMLFIHGSSDDKIPIEFNQRNFAAIPHSAKTWVTVPGANHHNVWTIGGSELEAQTNQFLLQFKANPPQ